jgi:hypothetical protein
MTHHRPFRAMVVAGLMLGLLTVGASRLAADWSENFNGPPANPPGGQWGWFTFNPTLQPVAYTPEYINSRLELRSPYLGGATLGLFASYVFGSGGSTAYHYQDVRVAGLVGVRNNGPLARNNTNMGIGARGNDFDVYILNIDNGLGALQLGKSRNADSTNPTFMVTQPIAGYVPASAANPSFSYYLVLDVLNTSSGAALTGRMYDRPGGALMHTIFAVDDASVPGDVLPPGFSAFYAQMNSRAAAPTTIDGFFDTVSSRRLVPGDVNFDRRIDRRDVVALAANFGKTHSAVWDEGDLDGNRLVNLSDLQRLQR